MSHRRARAALLPLLWLLAAACHSATGPECRYPEDFRRTPVLLRDQSGRVVDTAYVAICVHF